MRVELPKRAGLSPHQKHQSSFLCSLEGVSFSRAAFSIGRRHVQRIPSRIHLAKADKMASSPGRHGSVFAKLYFVHLIPGKSTSLNTFVCASGSIKKSARFARESSFFSRELEANRANYGRSSRSRVWRHLDRKSHRRSEFNSVNFEN